jgi:DNA adenine methylase
MKYMGSKNRIAKHLLPIILKDRKEGQWYVEPFVGGANMIDKVDGNRIGADLNPFLIKALELIRDNPESIPDVITEEEYKYFKEYGECTGITGFVAFSMSFGGKFFGGYRRDKAGTKGCVDNMKNQTRMAKNSAIKQSSNIKSVIFHAMPYEHLDIPSNSIIYCDPPYQGTTGYKDKFNHEDFWQWCRDKVSEGHRVFISEYNAPDDFKCVWQQELNVSVAKSGKHKKATEKLFVHESQN